MRMLMIVAVAGLATAGCTVSADVGVDTAVPEPPPGVVDGIGPDAPPAPPADPGEPPDMEVTAGETAVELTPFTYCWATEQAGVCADGIGQPERVVVTVPDVFAVDFVDGELSAVAGPAEGEQKPLPATLTAPGRWQVDASALPPGDHVVTLAWNGEQGDALAAFTVRRAA